MRKRWMPKKRLFEVMYQFGRQWHTKYVWAQSRVGAANKVFQAWPLRLLHKTRRSHLVFYPAKFGLPGKWIHAYRTDHRKD